MKFTTLIPTVHGDGGPLMPSVLHRVIRSLWRPFGGVTEDGLVTGHWIDDDGVEYTDVCVRVAVECERDRLNDVIRRVKRIGRKLGQRAMYFEVAGYDGVQILRIS